MDLRTKKYLAARGENHAANPKNDDLEQKLDRNERPEQNLQPDEKRAKDVLASDKVGERKHLLERARPSPSP